MSTDPGFQKVAISPLALLKQSTSLMGDQYWMFLAITFVGTIIASLVPMGILYGPMACGIYMCYFGRMQGKEASFDTLFKGFDLFVESLVATLIVVLISGIIIAPVIIICIAAGVGGAVAMDQGGSPWFLILFFLVIPVSILVSIVISSLFIFVYPLIVDKDLKAIPAVKTSCRAVLANLSGIIVAMLVWGFFAVLAALACGIGSVFYTPVMFGAIALLYRQIFPADAKTDPALS